MTTSTYLIEMPEDWKFSNCINCNKEHLCGDRLCPLANAKEAVEANIGDTIIDLENDGSYSVDGKPVRLYAVGEK